MISYSEFMRLDAIEVGELITVSTPSFEAEVLINVFYDNEPALIKVSLMMDSPVFKFIVSDKFDNLNEAKSYVEQQLAYCVSNGVSGKVLNNALIEQRKDELIFSGGSTFREAREYIFDKDYPFSVLN